MIRFWENLERFGDAPALIEGASGKVLSYRELADAVSRAAARFRAPAKKLVFLVAEADVEALAAYLGLLTSGHAVFLCSPSFAGLDRLVAHYRPDLLVFRASMPVAATADYKPADAFGGYAVLECEAGGVPPHPDLALLISTSGSTGSAKLVRLSHANIAVNAAQICEALAIGPSDRAITGLPMSYVYGLSVINTHLAMGASLVVETRSAADPAFWNVFARERVTSFAGVPWTYRLLKDAHFEKRDLPALRALTQAGGKIDAEVALWLVETFAARGVAVHFMYGMTEAAGRMTVLPSGLAREKPASVGRPVRGSTLDCLANGEIVYRGPNVMLGYAQQRADLARGDDAKGVLFTGDVGRIDEDGCLHITGRSHRLTKLFGKRIDLEEVQSYFRDCATVAVIGGNDRLVIFVQGAITPEIERLRGKLVEDLRVPQQLVTFRNIPEIPRTGSGKIMFHALPLD